MTSTFRRLTKLALSLTLVAPLLVGGTGCGGCPWIGHSAVVVTPDVACLQLAIANGSGDAPSTGCVNPVLYGENTCAEALVLPASHALDGQEVTVAAGTSFAFEVDLGACVIENDGYYAGIPAALGADAVLIEFDLYEP
ncbi:MAG: hypothetical protein EP329_00330 [Deltaproteobacteria bacterium]|nr:MAG: hypothetical protein EP329_00330 [Deltaproteobacteria bacterium]